MPKATRLGDNDTGHDACAPTALVTASTDVIINGKMTYNKLRKFNSKR